MKFLIVLAAIVAVSAAFRIEGPKGILKGPSGTLAVDTGSISKPTLDVDVLNEPFTKMVEVPTVLKMGIDKPTIVDMGDDLTTVLKMDKPLLKMGLDTVKIMPKPWLSMDWDTPLTRSVKLVNMPSSLGWTDSKIIVV